MKRSSGILLPIFSLPSLHGIGTLGQAAYDFIDFLAAAGQSWWQILPVGPTSYGDSPYQSFSTYAGNPYFIDLDLLMADGLLTAAEIAAHPWGDDPSRVDYETLYQNRLPILRLAFQRGREIDAEKQLLFTQENARWLPDYALFTALKAHFDQGEWMSWPEDIRLRHPAALAQYRALLAEEMELYTYLQYLFDKQWKTLGLYAARKKIGLIGDLPIYVALDSADVWAEPEFFQLDGENRPTEVAGVPPDYFSAHGQLWGNPLYNWEAMKKDGYGWWIRRVEGAAKRCDMLRIDHFRGFESYWAVPYGAQTAKIGRWLPGPGLDLVQVLTRWFPQVQLIAEDLGILTPAVRQLLRDSGLPGMRVLEFAFTPGDDSPYLPHNQIPDCICYTGTHDNTPLSAWRQEVEPEALAFASEYLGLHEEEGFHWGLLRGGAATVAALFVAQMQDYLGLGAESRTNVPGVLGGNWQWRLLPGQPEEVFARKIAELSHRYGRSPAKTEEL